MVRIHTQENPLKFGTRDLDVVVEKTEGYSGSDISNMVLGALFEPVRELQTATIWRHTSGDTNKMHNRILMYNFVNTAKL